MKIRRILLLICAAVLCFAQQKAPDPAFVEPRDVPGLSRALLIGDSISIGYTPAVRELLHGKANVHRIPINGGPTTTGLQNLDKWLGGAHWDVIHFNFGLHDLKLMESGKHQVELPEYQRNLRDMVATMKKTGAVLIWASTTPVPEAGTASRRRRRYCVQRGGEEGDGRSPSGYRRSLRACTAVSVRVATAGQRAFYGTGVQEAGGVGRVEHSRL